MVTSSYRPAPGRYLISEPFMSDENFQRTVVLLVEHTDEGSLGFVMNRQLNTTLPELIKDMPAFSAPVFMGGPVEQNSLHYIHRISALPGARHIAGDVYWSGNFDMLKTFIRDGDVDPADILFFVGYSGWGPQQLEGELERKSWIIAPENPEFIFQHDPNALWQDLLRSLGTKYKIISNYPTDPSLN